MGITTLAGFALQVAGVLLTLGSGLLTSSGAFSLRAAVILDLARGRWGFQDPAARPLCWEAAAARMGFVLLVCGVTAGSASLLLSPAEPSLGAALVGAGLAALLLLAGYLRLRLLAGAYYREVQQLRQDEASKNPGS